jgi:hypothetical protein
VGHAEVVGVDDQELGVFRVAESFAEGAILRVGTTVNTGDDQE